MVLQYRREVRQIDQVRWPSKLSSATFYLKHSWSNLLLFMSCIVMPAAGVSVTYLTSGVPVIMQRMLLVSIDSIQRKDGAVRIRLLTINYDTRCLYTNSTSPWFIIIAPPIVAWVCAKGGWVDHGEHLVERGWKLYDRIGTSTLISFNFIQVQVSRVLYYLSIYLYLLENILSLDLKQFEWIYLQYILRWVEFCWETNSRSWGKYPKTRNHSIKDQSSLLIYLIYRTNSFKPYQSFSSWFSEIPVSMDLSTLQRILIQSTVP